MNYELLTFCWLASCGLWIALFKSPAIPHLAEFFTKQPTSSDDVEFLLLSHKRYGLLTLYTCIWCQAFWTSALAALCYSIIAGPMLALPIFALALYPFTALLAWTLEKISGH